MSQAGTTSTGGSAPAAPSVVPIGGVDVDFLTLGDTTLFTTSSSPFLVIGYTSYGTLITGTTGLVVCNTGWTAPDYTDFYNDIVITGNVLATGQQAAQIPPEGSPHIVIPPSTTVKIHITTADSTAIANTQKITFLGFYF